ncbi:MAG: biotin/lipoyl-binding protein, partial [Deltaproteobacteria bacterium]
MTTIVDGPATAPETAGDERLEVVRPAQSPPEQPEEENGERRRRVRLIAAAVAVVLLVAGARYYLYWRHFETTDDAFVDGAVVEIAPQVAGRVAAVHVRDNQWVEAGDVLVEIDPDPYRTALEAARSERELARARVEAAKLALKLT